MGIPNMMSEVTPKKRPLPHSLFFMWTWGYVIQGKIGFLTHFWIFFAPIVTFISRK